MQDDYDEAAAAIVRNGHDPFAFPQLVLTRSAEESMAINRTEGPAIVIAGNGMCTAGRIKHRLKHNLWRSGVSVVIVGFQAAGTLGRRLVDGERTVKLYGEKIVVRAKVFTIGGFSAHADQALLLDWLSHFQNPKMQVYVIHGEPNASEIFASLVASRFGFATHVPAIGEVIALRPMGEGGGPAEVDLKSAEQLLSGLTQKARELQELLAVSSPGLRSELWARVETELARTEGCLDSALQEAKILSSNQ
jgi:metallo-beta-lactamase family protein